MPSSVMTLSRADRRLAMRERATSEYGAQADAALDLVELLELALRGAHGVATPHGVVDDVWQWAAGDLGRLVQGARLAVADPVGVHLAVAEHTRSR